MTRRNNIQCNAMHVDTPTSGDTIRQHLFPTMQRLCLAGPPSRPILFGEFDLLRLPQKVFRQEQAVLWQIVEVVQDGLAGFGEGEETLLRECQGSKGGDEEEAWA